MTIFDVNINVTLLNQILTIDLELAILNGTKLVFRLQMGMRRLLDSQPEAWSADPLEGRFFGSSILISHCQSQQRVLSR